MSKKELITETILDLLKEKRMKPIELINQLRIRFHEINPQTISTYVYNALQTGKIFKDQYGRYKLWREYV